MRKDSNTDNFVTKNSRGFINGLVLAKSRPRIVIPLPISFALVAHMFLSVLAENIIHFSQANWFMKIIDYSISIVCMVIIIVYNNNILALNNEIDNWGHYALFERETNCMKRKTELWLSQFDAFYYYFMRVGSVMYMLMPVGKFIYNDYTDTSDLLLYHSWTPFPIDTTWGFLLFYFSQLFTIYSCFFTFTSVSSYLLTATVTIGFQMELIGEACLTMDRRVMTMMRQTTLDLKGGWKALYEAKLQKEIKCCAMNYQNLYWEAKKMFRVFSLVPSFCFYPGMWIVVFCSVKLVSDTINNYSRIQAFIMVILVLLNQYLYSLISESLTGQVEKLRVTVYSSRWYNMPLACKKSFHLMQTMLFFAPTLTTMLGAKTNFEFFLKVVNASYYYISTLLSINIRYGYS